MGSTQRLGVFMAGMGVLLAGWIGLRPPALSNVSEAPQREIPATQPAPPPGSTAPAAIAPALGLPAEGRRDAPVPTSEIVATVAALEAKYRAGDAASGYALFTLLEQCARAPAIAEQLRRDRRELPAGPVSLPESVVNEAEFLEGECSRIAPGLLARRLEFLEAAAAHGDVRARLDYAAFPPEYFASTEGLIRNAEKVVEFKAKAIAWLHSAAERGAPLALLRLAGHYREGVLVERDNVTALAYYLAWDETGGGDGVDPYRQQREWGMTAAQLQQARDQQRRIVERCCR